MRFRILTDKEYILVPMEEYKRLVFFSSGFIIPEDYNIDKDEKVSTDIPREKIPKVETPVEKNISEVIQFPKKSNIIKFPIKKKED